MNTPERRTVHWPHHRTAVIIAAVPAVAGLAVLPWESAVVAYLVVWMVLAGAYLLYLLWAMVTGRLGVIHWAPTARRQRRLAARAATKEARLEQQRMDAAMSYGSYRPTAGRAQDHDLDQAGEWRSGRERPSGEELRA
jgi:hypothetical protein